MDNPFTLTNYYTAAEIVEFWSEESLSLLKMNHQAAQAFNLGLLT